PRKKEETGGRAVRKASAAVYNEPPPRPVRASPDQFEYLSGLDGRSRAPDVPDAGADSGADRGLHQISAAAENRLVQPGRGVGAGDESRQFLISTGSCKHKPGPPHAPWWNRL